MAEEEVGRPTVFTPEVLQKLEMAFSLRCTDKEACYFANIGESTLYLYQKNNPEFLERKHQLRNQAVMKARVTVVNALGTHPNIAFRFLEKCGSGDFARITDGVANQINFNISPEFSKELDDLVKLECGE